jgi:hypothetical protein
VHAVYKKAIQLGLRKDIKDLPPITANQLWGVLNVKVSNPSTTH